MIYVFHVAGIAQVYNPAVGRISVGLLPWGRVVFWVATTVVAIWVSYGVALVSWNLIEKRFLRLKDRFAASAGGGGACFLTGIGWGHCLSWRIGQSAAGLATCPTYSGENRGGLRLLSLVRIRLGIFLVCLTALGQARVEYAGGTIPVVDTGASGSIFLGDDHYLAFYTKKSQFRVPYSEVNLLEYGQQVNRRLGLAIVISPLFVMSKSRKHFLTVGYVDEFGRQQAMVFRVDKNTIRTTLVSLEARTGRKVEYQDEEARKAGK